MLMFDEKDDIQKSAGILFMIKYEGKDLVYNDAIKLYVTYQPNSNKMTNMVDAIKTLIPSYNWVLLLNMFFGQKELLYSIAYARMITGFIDYCLTVAFELYNVDNGIL